MNIPVFPSHRQLLFPLLAVLNEHGPLKAKDAAAAVAEKLSLPPEITSATVRYSGESRSANVFQRRVRWTRQSAVEAGFIVAGAQHGVWDLAERGHKTLTMSRAGVCVEVHTTDLGTVLFAEAKTAMAIMEPGSIQLCVTSSPFPLVVARPYGGWATDTFLDTLLGHIDMMKPLLTHDGSVVLNLGDTYEPGRPTLFPYQEALVLEMIRRQWHLVGKVIHVNPSKPKTTNYVTKTRERLASGFETYWHFATNPRPNCDNRRVLEPYSDTHLRTLAKGGELRRTRTGSRQSCPGLRYREDNGGRIPYNVITCPHEASNGPYVRFCKRHGLPVHPARMPVPVARFFVRYASAPGQYVFDPFAGSLVVPAVCEELGRPYVAIEKCFEYLLGGGFRLQEAAGFAARSPFARGTKLVSGIDSQVFPAASAQGVTMSA